MKKAFILAMTVFLVLSILSGSVYALSGGDIVGTWRLTNVVQDNKTSTPEETGNQATIVLNAENKAIVIFSDDKPQSAAWNLKDDSILIKNDSVDVFASYIEGKLIIIKDEAIMTFERETGGTEIVTYSPVKTDAVNENFIGAWSAVYFEQDGVFAKIEDIGIEMTLKITERNFESRERCGNNDTINMTTYAMDGYNLETHNYDGTSQFLSLHENGMISLPSNEYTVWFRKDAVELPPDGQWTCADCGQDENKGKYCTECGTMRPEAGGFGGWTCSCGMENEGKFCIECGLSKPGNLVWDKVVFDDGDTYDGYYNVETGYLEGFGVYQYTDGDIYYGMFRDGKRSGFGLYFGGESRNYFLIAGESREDMTNGNSRLHKRDHSIWWGQYENGEPVDGTMKVEEQYADWNGFEENLRLDNGSFYTGECNTNGSDFVEGYGVLTYPDGSMYIGKFGDGFTRDTSASGIFVSPDHVVIEYKGSSDEYTRIMPIPTP
jgi:hypothetical protein